MEKYGSLALNYSFYTCSMEHWILLFALFCMKDFMARDCCDLSLCVAFIFLR